VEGERERLLGAITALEGQRAVLGDAVVDTSVAPLRERLAALDAEAERPPEEQRKLVTVLFADLVGFTAMSETMDPEDVRELTTSYFARWAEVVEGYGGMVEKFIGDAVLAVFGLPVASEDDPERAVRAALDMVAGLQRLNDELEPRWGRRLSMRVGVNSGMALTTSLDERRGDFVVVGDVVNTASRLQSAAPEGGILISHDTYRHVRGVFDVQPQEPLRVKGKAEPLQVYVVLGAKRRAFRMAVRGVDDVDTPFLGRARELGVLQETLLDMATFGHLRVVTLVGEAGVGKSRLLFEFDNWVELLPERFGYFKARTSPASENHPYSLLRDLVATRFQVQESDPPSVVRDKVERAVCEVLGGDPDGAIVRAHFLGHLVGFDFSTSPHVAGAIRDARQLRDRGIAALADVLCATASQAPAVVLLEDLHWADDSSLNALADLSGRLLDHPVFVICTARPGLLERRPNWGGGLPDSERIELAPLTGDDAGRIVDAMLPGEVPAELRRLVVEQAEGNPFYVEELVAMLVEDGVVARSGDRWELRSDGPLELRVPPTLTGVIQARLDVLSPPDRSVLQRASVVGRTFWDQAVAHVAAGEHDPTVTEQALGVLRQRDMVFQSPRSAFDETREFLFKHALLRDVTYESVLRRDRRRYHSGTAGWLEQATERSERVDEYAAVIAEHHERAGELHSAARWYARAAARAAATFANAEAARFATRALELGPHDDVAWRFDLHLARERLHDLAGERPAQLGDLDALIDLADRLDDDALRATVWLRRAAYEAILGDYEAALAAGERAVDLAVAAGDKGLEAEGELEQASVLWRRAEYDEATAHLHRSRELADSAGRTATAALAVRSLGIVAHVRGQWSAANAYLGEALRLAKELGDERLEGQVVNSMGIVALDSGDFATARAHYQRSLEVKRRIGDRRGETSTLHNLGVLAAEVGDVAVARRYLRQALDASRATQDAEGESVALLVLGATAVASGDHVGARTLLERALPLLRELDDRQGESEALSFLAMVDHRQGDDAAAIERGRAAADLAHRVDNPREEFQGLTVLGHALFATGRLDEAAAAYERALTLRQQVEPDDTAVAVLAGLARVDLARGRLDEALARVRQVLASGRLVDRHSFDEPGMAALVAYEVLAAAGDEEGAADVLRRAGDLLEERSARLDDDDRSRFLNDVPAHRRLTELLATAGRA
jgi:class 3 adenylate cyclase/tetratricopeptide (TPR) repeat protein